MVGLVFQKHGQKSVLDLYQGGWVTLFVKLIAPFAPDKFCHLAWSSSACLEVTALLTGGFEPWRLPSVQRFDRCLALGKTSGRTG